MLTVKDLFFEKLQWSSVTTINIKMISFDDPVDANKTEHNKNWSYIPDHPYKILMRFSIGKNKCIIEFNENQPEIDKIYLHAKDPFEAKYWINKREVVGINPFIDPKAFIEYSNDMHDIYTNIDEYNTDKENKILVVFDDIIAVMIRNKKLNSVVTELFIRGRKLNISLVFITQSYFKVPKDVKY